jgi:c-di-GMP-binding flagellar brake protein YcgR
MTKVEKRKFSRIPLTVKVKYDVLKVSPRWAEENRSNDVSAGGICLTTVPEKIDIGALLRLKLFFQDEDDFITIKGKVVWVEEFSINHTSDHKAYDCGLEFVDVDPQYKKNSRYLISGLINAVCNVTAC